MSPQAFGSDGSFTIGAGLLDALGMPNPGGGALTIPTLGDADITIATKDGSRRVDGWLTDDAGVPTSGYGGFQGQSRPKKPAITVWEGRDGFEVPVPMLLYKHGNSTAGDVADLDWMGSGAANKPPPVVWVAGAVLLPARASGNWRINAISWGKQVRRASDKAIIFQLVTVTLLEDVTDKRLAASTLNDRRGRKTVVKHYTVKKGDTLRSIAAHQLGDIKRWVDIAALNGLRSDGHLKLHSVLRLP